MSVETEDEVIPPTNTENEQEQPVVVPPPSGDLPPWMKRRIAEEKAKRVNVETENQRLQQQLAELRQQPAEQQMYGQEQQMYQPSQHEINALIEKRAAELAGSRVQQESFNTRLTDVERLATEKYGDRFNVAVRNFADTGLMSQDMLNAMVRVDNPEAVITYLGQNVNMEETARIANLDPVGMAVELAKLSGKAVKALAVKVSNAPPPLDDSNDAGEGTPAKASKEPKIGTKEWIDWRNKQVRERGRR